MPPVHQLPANVGTVGPLADSALARRLSALSGGECRLLSADDGAKLEADAVTALLVCNKTYGAICKIRGATGSISSSKRSFPAYDTRVNGDMRNEECR